MDDILFRIGGHAVSLGEVLVAIVIVAIAGAAATHRARASSRGRIRVGRMGSPIVVRVAGTRVVVDARVFTMT